METCENCPFTGRTETCPRWPTDHATYCNWVNPSHPNYRRDGAAILIGIANHEPPRSSTPRRDATPDRPRPAPVRTPPVVPLAGDLVAALTARIGADRAAEWVASKLGKQDCGCGARKARLNALDAKVRAFLSWGK